MHKSFFYNDFVLIFFKINFMGICIENKLKGVKFCDTYHEGG